MTEALKCPKCKGTDHRPAGVIVAISLKPRWRWFGPLTWQHEHRGNDYSCANPECGFCWTRLGHQTIEAPNQRLHDMLKEAERIVERARKEPNGKPEKEQEEPGGFDLDLAPDPRARRRR